MDDKRPRTGLTQISADDFQLSAAIGGVRGVIESVAPVVVFLSIYLVTHRLWWAAGCALAVAGVLLIARLVSRTPLTQALGGFFGVAICCGWAAYSGSAEGYFAPGLAINAVYGAVVAFSVLVRYPLIGFIDSLARGLKQWRHGPRMRRYDLLTVMWAALFALRLAVQWPLYVSGNLTALGAARLIMGVPMFAAAIFVSWLVLRDPHPGREAPADPAPNQDPPAHRPSR